MGCLNIKVTTFPSSAVAVDVVSRTELAVTAPGPMEVGVETVTPAAVAATPVPQAAVAVTPVETLKVSLGEICSVSSGTIVVLAASDGPLRTRDGGYFLLNPATNPPE